MASSRKFKSLEEAMRWAETEYPHITWDFVDAHLAAITPTLMQFHRLARDFPAVVARLEYCGTYRGANSPRKYFWQVNDYAHASQDGRRMGLNPLWYGDAEKLAAEMQANEAAGWFAQGGGTIAYLLTHEFGHQVAHWLRSLTHKAVLEVVGLEGLGLVSHTFAAWQKSHQATGQLSRYALRDIEEAWAEGFAAQYHSPRNAWPMYVKEQRKLLAALHPTLHIETFVWYADLPDEALRKQAQDLLTGLRERLGL
jgi:hypothetical protein